MIKVTATNFGLNPDDIQIRAYQGDKFIILNGELTVDTTAEAYKKIFSLELTVEGLNFEKSLPTAVYVTDATEGAHNITITKAQIKNGNTISIRPMRSYDSLGAYKVHFLCAFAQSNTACNSEPQLYETPTLEPTVGSMTDAECYLVKDDNWMLLVLKATTLTFDENEAEIRTTLPGVPETLKTDFPVIFTESQYSDTGSKFYPATIENGVLTIRKDGNADEADGTPAKFAKAFILLNQ